MENEHYLNGNQMHTNVLHFILVILHEKEKIYFFPHLFLHASTQLHSAWTMGWYSQLQGWLKVLRMVVLGGMVEGVEVGEFRTRDSNTTDEGLHCLLWILWNCHSKIEIRPFDSACQCIHLIPQLASHTCLLCGGTDWRKRSMLWVSVSYTHLTLPTIYSV